MSAGEKIIQHLVRTLASEHGYGFESHYRRASSEEARRVLDEIENDKISVSTVRDFVHRETNVGRPLENEVLKQHALKQIGKISAIGALPTLTPPKHGFLSGVLAWTYRGEYSEGESELLNELLTQGKTRLGVLISKTPVDTPEQALKKLNDHVDDLAVKEGLIVTKSTSLDDLRTVDIQDLFSLLIDNDPYSALGGMSEFSLIMNKPGFQGLIKDILENDKFRESYENLVEKNVVPALAHKPRAGGDSLKNRIINRAMNMFSAAPAFKELPPIIALGRDVVRSVLVERAAEIELSSDGPNSPS